MTHVLTLVFLFLATVAVLAAVGVWAATPTQRAFEKAAGIRGLYAAARRGHRLLTPGLVTGVQHR